MDDNPKNQSRRAFVKKAALGAAALGTVAAAPSVLRLAGDAISGNAAATPSVDTTQKVVAYVRDPVKGEIVVMQGSKEVVRLDAGLTQRLLVIASG